MSDLPRRAITGAPKEWTPMVLPYGDGPVEHPYSMRPTSSTCLTRRCNDLEDVDREPRRAVR